MSITIDRKAFVENLSILSRVVPSKPPREILKSVKLSAVDGVLSMEGNDSENGLRVSCACEGRPLDTLLEFSRLEAIVRSITDDSLSLDIGDTTATIVAGGGTFRLGCVKPDEYPALPSHADEQKALIVCSEFAEALLRGEPWAKAARWDEMLVETDQHGIATVAAEDRCLYWSSIKTLARDEGINCLVPSAACRLIAGFVGGQPGSCEVGFSKSTICARTDRGTAVCRLGSGKFPPWRKILEQTKFLYEADWLRESALTILGQALVSTQPLDRRMKMAFSANMLTLETHDGPYASEIEIPFAWDNLDYECIYSAELIQKAIASMPAGANVRLNFSEPGNPLRLDSGSIGFLIAACEG